MSLAETVPEERITAPTQVLWPEHDPLFPRAWGDRLDEFFADVTVTDLPGAGHFSPLEAPEAWAAEHRRPMEGASRSRPARASRSCGPTARAAATPAPAAGRRSSSRPAASTVELSGGEPHTTNNRMEYTAALEGLRSLPPAPRSAS